MKLQVTIEIETENPDFNEDTIEEWIRMELEDEYSIKVTNSDAREIQE